MVALLGLLIIGVPSLYYIIAYPVWAMVDAGRSTALSSTQKSMWIVFIFIASTLGAAAYFLMYSKTPRSRWIAYGSIVYMLLLAIICFCAETGRLPVA